MGTKRGGVLTPRVAGRSGLHLLIPQTKDGTRGAVSVWRSAGRRNWS